MRMIVSCLNCGSEKLTGKQCEACLDRSDEEWAIHEARETFSLGVIDLSEFEQRIEQALTNPPKRQHPHIVFG